MSCPGQSVPLYRLWNDGLVDHFYTTNAVEALQSENNGYVFDKVAGCVYASATATTIPLYRLYSKKQTDHFYTTDASERQAAIGSGYADEGIAAYVYSAPGGVDSAVAFYRLWQGSPGLDHFYTTDVSEVDFAETKSWAFEWVQCYVIPVPTS